MERNQQLNNVIDLSQTSDSFKLGMQVVQDICRDKTPAEQAIISKFCGEVLQAFVAMDVFQPLDGSPDMDAVRQVADMIKAKDNQA